MRNDVLFFFYQNCFLGRLVLCRVLAKHEKRVIFLHKYIFLLKLVTMKTKYLTLVKPNLESLESLSELPSFIISIIVMVPSFQACQARDIFFFSEQILTVPGSVISIVQSELEKEYNSSCLF